MKMRRLASLPPYFLPVLLAATLVTAAFADAAREDSSGSSVLSPRTVSPDDARLIAAISTWTQLSFVTSITTVPLTCNRAVQGTVACKKRRRYGGRKFSLIPNFNDESSVPAVDGSINEGSSVARPDYLVTDLDGKNDEERSGRLALTVWRSFTSTYTMIMTSTNNAVTFSVSIACTIQGASFPAPC
ncbi:uncharacterized protein LOC108664861 [Hyalella azteca]|uniref:Uncharacterized protein LOC108664861 n=1 Tax=Hyalella azteca TaxID=294128 RepID=A0A8B7MZN6_HYAAZ|nr:uncharacterized protein LOC108664861 [Hyalella azteca]